MKVFTGQSLSESKLNKITALHVKVKKHLVGNYLVLQKGGFHYDWKSNSILELQRVSTS